MVEVGPTEYPVPDFLGEAIASNAIVVSDRNLMDMELISRQLLISLFDAENYFCYFQHTDDMLYPIQRQNPLIVLVVLLG